MRQILQEAIPLDHLPESKMSKNDRRISEALLVRGAKKKFKSRVGKSIRIDELLDVMWFTRSVNVGTRGILALCAYDSKGRFILWTPHSGPPWRVYRHGDMADMDFCVAWPQ